MRIASNTKAWTSGAMYDLIKAKKVDPSAKVFKYLGIAQPLPETPKVDERVYDITIEDMILHESAGTTRSRSTYDPTFKMRDIALALGLKHAVEPVEYVHSSSVNRCRRRPERPTPTATSVHRPL